jgi:hypothetical protein
MKLSGLHLLLTYQCLFECDHCFVFAGPGQTGVMTLKDIRNILDQAAQLGTVESIYFEGGEPFLYYAVLVRGVTEAAALGFSVGVVTNAYWATAHEDALEWLRPLAGAVEDLSISSDLHHSDQKLSPLAATARQAAQELGIPCGLIQVSQPVENQAHQESDPDQATLMYRGRAAQRLAPQARQHPWTDFRKCPYEDFHQPGRWHVDPFGNLFVCQGLIVGNLFKKPLEEIVRTYDPARHPVAGPLSRGGPVELVKHYGLDHDQQYADACHLCDQARRALRRRFPEVLGPDQVYRDE